MAEFTPKHSSMPDDLRFDTLLQQQTERITTARNEVLDRACDAITLPPEMTIEDLFHHLDLQSTVGSDPEKKCDTMLLQWENVFGRGSLQIEKVGRNEKHNPDLTIYWGRLSHGTTKGGVRNSIPLALFTNQGISYDLLTLQEKAHQLDPENNLIPNLINILKSRIPDAYSRRSTEAAGKNPRGDGKRGTGRYSDKRLQEALREQDAWEQRNGKRKNRRTIYSRHRGKARTAIISGKGK